MTKIPSNKPVYDLEERTFSRRVGIKILGFSSIYCPGQLQKYWKNQNSLDHWYLEFEILVCLWHGVWNLILEIWNLFGIWCLEFEIS